jgi:hypothetical protein
VRTLSRKMRAYGLDKKLFKHKSDVAKAILPKTGQA